MAYYTKNISELFGYRQNDVSEKAVQATKLELCPFTSHRCTKTSHDRKNVYGVCSVSAGETPTNKSDVIVCPKRFYGMNYEILRGCLKKIDKIAFSIVLGVVYLSASGKSGNFEQNLVWLGLNFQFWRVRRPIYMMLVHENLEFSIFQTAS